MAHGKVCPRSHETRLEMPRALFRSQSRIGMIHFPAKKAWREIKEGCFHSTLLMRSLRATSSQRRWQHWGDAESGDPFFMPLLLAGSGAERPLPEGAQSAPPCACRDLHNVPLDSDQITPARRYPHRTRHFSQTHRSPQLPPLPLPLKSNESEKVAAEAEHLPDTIGPVLLPDGGERLESSVALQICAGESAREAACCAVPGSYATGSRRRLLHSGIQSEQIVSYQLVIETVTGVRPLVAALVKARADLQVSCRKVSPRSHETRLRTRGAQFHSQS